MELKPTNDKQIISTSSDYTQNELSIRLSQPNLNLLQNGYESGDQGVLLMKKPKRKKSHASIFFKYHQGDASSGRCDFRRDFSSPPFRNIYFLDKSGRLFLPRSKTGHFLLVLLNLLEIHSLLWQKLKITFHFKNIQTT